MSLLYLIRYRFQIFIFFASHWVILLSIFFIGNFWLKNWRFSLRVFRCYFSNLVALIVVLIWVNTLIIWNLMILLNRRLSKHILILIYIATTIHLFYLIIFINIKLLTIVLYFYLIININVLRVLIKNIFIFSNIFLHGCIFIIILIKTWIIIIILMLNC